MTAPEPLVAHDPREMWEIARSQLRLQMTKSTYETWVRDTTCLAYEDGTFIVAVNNAYAKEWLSLRLRSTIKRTLTSILGRAADVTFVVQTAPAPEAPQALPAPLLELESRDEADASAPSGVEGTSLNPRYTFENFIVGPSNRMAHAVALSVAERPGRAYNPLFLYGGVGLGKTHLLQAIGHFVKRANLRVLYISSEVFANELISAIRTQSTDQFRAKYRTMDVLLIDDVHFIAGKEQTQEEFFHTFNALHSANRQIVLTSDRPPQAIPLLEERLRSRFGWGMIADIQPPNLETRIAILQVKAASLGRHVPDEVLAAIAQRVHNNIRDLEGALTTVLAHAEVAQRPLTVALVEDALAYLVPSQPRLSPEMILNLAADYFGVSVAELTGRSRAARIALQRQIVMYLIREETDASLPQIGELLGGRDHTTVIHGCERIAAEMDGNTEVSRQVNELRAHLYAPVRVR
ncbi:MAG: chromosomal replication initiator protein DnaA [Anaerolineae bacterium]|nr:chromosomal replication initiator protein DnaA [Anaerolineae bacterium]